MSGSPGFRADFPGGISLQTQAAPDAGYPTSRIPKGLTLTYDGVDFTEEGLGFGVPVLRTAVETIFPSARTILMDPRDPARLVIRYEMGLVERLDGPACRIIHFLNDIAARLHRAYPFTRHALNAAAALILRASRLTVTYGMGKPRGRILCHYSIDARRAEVRVIVDSREARVDDCREIIVMNELGAERFSSYCDSLGNELRGKGIESWARVRADWARFQDPASGVAFTLRQKAGARLFRGRERADGRLSWAGFAYVARPGKPVFEYSANIRKVD